MKGRTLCADRGWPAGGSAYLLSPSISTLSYLHSHTRTAHGPSTRYVPTCKCLLLNALHVTRSPVRLRISYSARDSAFHARSVGIPALQCPVLTVIVCVGHPRRTPSRLSIVGRPNQPGTPPARTSAGRTTPYRIAGASSSACAVRIVRRTARKKDWYDSTPSHPLVKPPPVIIMAILHR